MTYKSDDKDFEEAFKRFRQLGENTDVPIILKLYERYEENVLTKETVLYMLRMVESFILRRSILKMRARGYGEDFAKACDHIENPIKLIKYFTSKGWPTNEDIRKVMPEFAFYHHEPQKCKLVLQEIERSYGHKESVEAEKLSIEHIMPQHLTINWVNALGNDAEKKHAKYLHTLGNLTLTAYNAEMSDNSFEEKRKNCLNTSHVQLNAYFGKMNAWTEQEIIQRTKDLTERFIKIWERPDQTG